MFRRPPRSTSTDPATGKIRKRMIAAVTAAAVVVGGGIVVTASAPEAARADEFVVPSGVQSMARAKLIDADLFSAELLDVATANAHYPGAAGPERASLDVELLQGKLLDLGKIDLPLVDSADREGLLKFGADAAVGVANGYAETAAANVAVAASGVVTDQGSLDVGPADSADDYASLRLTPLFSQLGVSPLTDGILDDASLKFGALFSRADWTAGQTPKTQYSVAGLDLNLSSPAVKALSGTIQSAVSDVSDTVNGLLGETGTVQQTLDGLNAINVNIGIAKLSLGDPQLNATVDLSGVTEGILAEPIKSDDGLVTINLGTGIITVDLAQLHGGDLNGLPANTQLLTSAEITQITTTVTNLLGNVVQKVTDAVTAALLSTEVVITLTPEVEVLAGVVGSDLGVTVEGTLGEFLGQVATKPDVNITGNLTLLGIPVPVGKLLDVIVSPILTTLVPAIGSALQPVIATSSTVIETTLNAVLTPLITALGPVLSDVLGELVDITINEQEGGPANGSSARAPLRVTALSLDVLPSDPLVALDLANSTVISAGTAAYSLSPDRGTKDGGTVVTISGIGLNSVTAATFGGTAVTGPIVHVDDNTIKVTTPVHAPGPVGVVLTGTDNGTPIQTAPLTYTYTQASTITGIAPAKGPVAGGTAVTLTGTGFTGATKVTIGGATPAFTVVDDATITFTTPAHAAGAVPVVVTSSTGNDSASQTFTYVPNPTVNTFGLSPTTGPEYGGTYVTITGTGFTADSTATFGGVPATVLGRNAAGTELYVLSPAYPVTILTAVPVVVGSTVAGVGTASAGDFWYSDAILSSPPTITSVAPASGPLGGGTVVTITGSGFATGLGTNDVIIGGKLATSVTTNSASSITATVPAGAAPGPVGVIVIRNPLVGASVGTLTPATFTYLNGPAITAITPSEGPLTATPGVVITGSGFNTLPANTQVLVGGTALATYTIDSATQITATIPAGTAGPTSVVVRSTGEGAATAATLKLDSNAVTYTRFATPTIDGSAGAWAVDPKQGPTTGGTQVTITGTGFVDGKTTVSFGESGATSILVNSATELIAFTPAHAAGAVDVTVATPGGRVTAADAFTYYALPTATAIAPDSGSTLGGETVTITGTGFVTGVTTVTLTAADGSTVDVTPATITPSGLTFVTPAHAAGRVGATVTTPGGTTAPLTYTFVAPPTLTSLAPLYGPIAGGTAVTITGTGFVAGSGVKLDGVAVDTSDVTVLGVTQLRFTTPAHDAGAVAVTVTGPGGTSTAGTFTYLDAPTVGSVSSEHGTDPGLGKDTGGDVVTITGTWFVPGVTTVDLGGQAGTNVTVTSDTTLTVTSPAHTAGTVDVTVTTPGGDDTFDDGFTFIATPRILAVDPPLVATTGLVPVKLLGSNLDAVTTVAFDGTTLTAGTDYTIGADGSSITLLSVPAHAVGTVAITVANVIGVSDDASLAYGNVPVITSLSPDTVGTAGAPITLVVDKLDGATPVVVIDGVIVPITSSVFDPDTGLTTIVVTAPAHAVGPVGVVVGDSTTGATSAPETLTYIPAPTIDPYDDSDPSDVRGVSPTYGPTAGGTLVTITGTGFVDGHTTVLFGDVPGTDVDVAADGLSLTVRTDAHAPALVDVTVMTPGGSVVAEDAFSFIADPNAQALNPATGSTLGGTRVTITGTALAGATSVTFGGEEATDFLFNGDGSLTVSTPAHAAGVVTVVVTNPVGSSTLTNAYTYVVPPVIAALDPTSGTTLGGTPFTITGANLTGATVTFGGDAATDVVVTATQITGKTPAHAAGSVSVQVTTPAGMALETYLYVAPPTASGLTPASGFVTGNEEVTITGTGFVSGKTTVTIGGTIVVASSVTVASDGASLTFLTPARARGAVGVSVATPYGSVSGLGYTYLALPTPVTGLDPVMGTMFGNTPVTVTGTGFTPTSVIFQDGDAQATTYVSDTELTFTTLAHAAGPVTVTVRNDEGIAAAGQTYTFVDVPVVFAVMPPLGSTVGNETVTIAGINLAGATSVLFGSSPATITANTAGSITVTTPPHTAGPVNVTVTTPGGTGTVINGYAYVAPPTPVIVSITPNAGSASGNQEVTIAGSLLAGTTSVTFGGIAATPLATNPDGSFVLNGDGTLTVTTPAHGPGPVDVILTATAGTTTSSDGYTYFVTPAITDVSPDHDLTTGGEEITITGTGFTGTTRVVFGDVNVPAFTVNDDGTVITLDAPANVAGVTAIVVTTPGGNASHGFTYYAVPTATSLSPAAGPTDEATLVTIHGTGFVPGAIVTIDGTNVVPTTITATTITFYAPATDAPGEVLVTVTTPGGTTPPLTYEYVDGPVAASLDPAQGPTAGGYPVSIHGTGFAGATSVTFGDTVIPLTGHTDDEEITVTAPADVAGIVQVSVTGPFGMTNDLEFTYVAAPTLTVIAPATAPADLTTSVDLTGTGFVVGATTVTIGAVTIPASEVTVTSTTTLTFTAPARERGTVNVSVTTAGGTTSALPFRYLLVPTAAEIDPPAGPLAGGPATITGTGFVPGETVVLINGEPATGVTVSADGDEVTFTLPPATDPATVPIVVVTPDGQTTPLTHTYLAAPANLVLTPIAGPTAGDTTVSITGDALANATAVLIGDAVQTFAASAAEITALTAPHAAGFVDVTVTTPGGTVTLTNGYEYVAPPTLTSLSPDNGPTAGNQTVQFIGTGLDRATSVTFGGDAATFSVVDGVLTAVTPPHIAGEVSAVVTTPGGTVLLPYRYIAAPTVTGMDPVFGPVAGGTDVTITGTGFWPGVTVTIDGETITPAVNAERTSLTFETPAADAPGPVDVVVTTTAGSTAPQTFTYYATPVIGGSGLIGLDPDHGPADGGTEVEITGSGFTGATDVLFGDIPAIHIEVFGDTRIVAISPEHAAGSVGVAVVNPLGTSNEAPYLFIAAPAIAELSPNQGPAAGGTSVTISGENLEGATSVTVDGVSVPFTPNEDGTITIVMPPHGSGEALVVVTTPGGVSEGIPFSYIDAPVIGGEGLVAIDPTVGPTGGGTAVTVRGSGFTGATDVLIGDDARSFTVVNDTTIAAVTDAHAAGLVDVTIVTPGGSATAEDAFRYVAAPTLSGIDPDNGPRAGGQTVVLSGTGLEDVTSVTFGGEPAEFTIGEDGTITAITPAHVPGQVAVVVATPGGVAQVPYWYLKAPTATAIEPDLGPLAGGTEVTITGSDFWPGVTVTIGGQTVTPTASADGTELTFTTPPGATAGPVDVIVTTRGGSAEPLVFTYVGVPTIGGDGVIGLTPNVGPTTGGTVVTVTGTGFIEGATTVTIGGVTIPAEDVRVLSPEELTFTTPAHSAGAAAVTVATAGGTSDDETFTFYDAPTAGSISPNEGPIAGGGTVTIEGTGFVPGQTTVTVDGVPVTGITVSPDGTTITFPMPPGTGVGTVDVVVTTPGGTTDPLPYEYVAPEAPKLTGIAPADGPDIGGTTVTLTGTGLDGATAIVIDGVTITDFTVGDGTITFTTPAHPAGAVQITVMTPNGSSNPVTFTFEDSGQPGTLAPWISGIDPTSGPTRGGTTVTLTGTGFLEATDVTFGGAPGTDVEVIDDETLTVTTPAHAVGPVAVVVAAGPRESVPATYTYVEDGTEIPFPQVTGMTPVVGPTTGGTVVTITGSGFDGTTVVSFGELPDAPNARSLARAGVVIGSNTAAFTLVSDTTIVATTPTQFVGPVDVRLTAAGGTTSAGIFTYVEDASAPVISGLSPNSGTTAGGTTVVISGTGLVNATNVLVGGVELPFIVTPDGKLTITMPPHAAGIVNVVVVTPTGTSNTASYTYVKPGGGGTDGGSDGQGGTGTGQPGKPNDSGDGVALAVTGIAGTGVFGALLFAFALIGTGAGLVRRRLMRTR